MKNVDINRLAVSIACTLPFLMLFLLFIGMFAQTFPSLTAWYVVAFIEAACIIVITYKDQASV